MSSIFSRIVCLAIGHKMGVWDYRDAGDCTQTSSCRRCGHTHPVQTRTHVWSEWSYADGGSCRQVRTCKRCEEKENNVMSAHCWGDWNYENRTSCRQLRTCERCGEVDKKDRILHDWSEWRYDNQESCSQSRVCERCHSDDSRVCHDWKRTGRRETCSQCHGTGEVGICIDFETQEETFADCSYCNAGFHAETQCTRCQELGDSV